MNNFFIKVFLLSFSGSIIALIMLTIRPLIKSRLSKTWQYYIWLAVVLRLLIPFAPEISLMNFLYNLIENNSGIISTPIDMPMTGIIGIVTKYIGIVWLSIAAIQLLKKVVSYLIYSRFIKANRKIITDVNITRMYAEVCAEMGIRKIAGLYSYKMINSPMLIGYFKPYIVLPEAMLQTTEDLKYVLFHEITHYKRKDFLYKWLIQIAACMHFFNPVVFLIIDAVNKSCEFSCDEAVIKKLDNGGKKAYGSALINSLETNGGYRKHIAVSTMLCEDAEQIKERLDAIVHYKKSTKIALAATCILTVMICFGSVYIGVFKNIYSNCSCSDNLADSISVITEGMW